MRSLPKSGGLFEPYIRITKSMTKTVAWQALNSTERALWIEILRYYRGRNDGSLFLSHRTAALAIHRSKDTVSRAFIKLEQLGFIEVGRPRTWCEAPPLWLTTDDIVRDGQKIKAPHTYRDWTPGIRFGRTDAEVRSATGRRGIPRPKIVDALVAQEGQAVPAKRTRTSDAVGQITTKRQKPEGLSRPSHSDITSYQVEAMSDRAASPAEPYQGVGGSTGPRFIPVPSESNEVPTFIVIDGGKADAA